MRSWISGEILARWNGTARSISYGPKFRWKLDLERITIGVLGRSSRRDTFVSTSNRNRIACEETTSSVRERGARNRFTGNLDGESGAYRSW